MGIDDVKFVSAIVDRDVEQCAIVEIVGVVEVGEIIRKFAAPKTRMRHRCNQVAIRAEKPGDFR